MGRAHRASGLAPASQRWAAEEEEEEGAKGREAPGQGGTWSGSGTKGVEMLRSLLSQQEVARAVLPPVSLAVKENQL